MKSLTTIIAFISILVVAYGLNSKSENQLRAQGLLQNIGLGKMTGKLSIKPLGGNFISLVCAT